MNKKVPIASKMEVSLSPDPETNIISNDAAAASTSVREKWKRINQAKMEMLHNNGEGNDDNCNKSQTKNNHQLIIKNKGGSTPVAAAASKRRSLTTCKPSGDNTSSSHSQTPTHKPRFQLRHKINAGSPQLQQHLGRETRSNKAEPSKRATTISATLTVAAVNHNLQIGNAAAANGSFNYVAIKSKSKSSGELTLNTRTRSSSSDELKTKMEKPPNSEPDETAVLDYPSSEFTDTTSSCTVSVNGDGGACDAEIETRSDQSDVGEGTEELMKTLDMNEIDPTETHTEHDRQPNQDEQFSEEEEKEVLICADDEGISNAEEEIEDKRTDSSVSNLDIEEEEESNNNAVVEFNDPVGEPYTKPGLSRANSRSSSKPAAIGRSGSNKQPTTPTPTTTPIPIKKQYHPTFSRPISNPKCFPPSVTRIPDKRHQRRVPQSHTTSKLQCLADLVMWSNVPKTALVFGIGTFLIVSSSLATNLDISFISVTSYLGLIYLGVIFLYKSFINRDVTSGADQNYHGVGEQDVIWALRLILPYVNESVHKLAALFSGDPATTMKVAAVLFVMARSGGSITIWKLIKLGFFAAFTLPKMCSSYSNQITGYGKFWIRRFGDAWESCSQKKAAALGMFSIVWSFSSVTARIWAAFMLVAAVRYYQQSKVGAEWPEVETEDKNGANVEKQTGGKQTWVRNGRQTAGVRMKKVM